MRVKSKAGQRFERVIVTGANSGIGRASALQFARAGSRLWVCDLPSGDLPALEAALLGAGAAEAHALAVDVGSAAEMAAFCEQACSEGAPDVLVNNAGVGLAGGALATTLEDWHWLLNANLWGVVHGCHFFAPKMVARRQGQIINIASAAGFYNSEAMTAYGTTKYAVIGLSEGLRAELSPYGVGVSVICPGFIDTAITETMRLRGARYPEHERSAVQRFYRRRNYTPERVARAVFRAAHDNPALLPVTPEAWTLYLLKRAAPELTHRLLDTAQRWAARRSSIQS